MSDQITITVSLAQAEALVEAANCTSLAAEGDLRSLIKCFTPAGITIAREADRMIVGQAELAQEVARMLHHEIDNAYKRDPEMQSFLHRFKMLRKRGLDRDA